MKTLEEIIQQVALSAQVIALKYTLKDIGAEERDSLTQKAIEKGVERVEYLDELRRTEAEVI